MDTNKILFGLNKKALLSTIWIFVVVNYLYCDIMSLMEPALLKQYLAGNVGGMEITQGFLLGAAVLMEISMSMILLSRILPYKANRVANLIAGAITTLVQIATLFFGDMSLYYFFFSIFEIAGTATVFWLALRWKNVEE